MIRKLCTILLLAAFVAPAWAQQTRGDKEGVVFAPRKGQWQVSLVLGNSGQSYNDNVSYLLPKYTNTEGSIGLPNGGTDESGNLNGYLNISGLNDNSLINIAGLQAANIIAADPEIRRKIDRQLVDNELHALNAFAVEALIAAYNEGGEWLDELKKYLWENYEYLRDFFTRHLPALPVTPLEATYLVWVDCRTLKRPTTEIARQLLEEGHVWINEGEMYAGEGFLRINIACPRKTLAEGLERIRKVVG